MTLKYVKCDLTKFLLLVLYIIFVMKNSLEFSQLIQISKTVFGQCQTMPLTWYLHSEIIPMIEGRDILVCRVQEGEGKYLYFACIHTPCP